MSDQTFDVIDPEGLGFRLKERESKRVYRVIPARDPRQPRLWCVLVYRCASSGVADDRQRPWFGAQGMTRDELVTALAAIRADVDAWLDRPECRDLRRWMRTPDPGAAVPLAPAIASVAVTAAD